MIKKISFISGFMFLIVSFYTLAFAETSCNVCSMKILDDSRQHFRVSDSSAGKEPLHVCSVTCLHKMKKFNSKLSSSHIEISNFNDSSKFLKSDKAFFLVKSDKIKEDVGPMAMPPIAAAFATQKEAEAAQKKYGDGIVVLGLEEALKSIGK